MDSVHRTKKLFSGFPAAQRINDFAELPRKAFFVIQHVKSDENSHYQIKRKVHCCPSKEIEVPNNGFQRFREVFRSICDGVHYCIDIFLYCFAFDKINFIKKYLDTLVQIYRISRQLARQRNNAGFQFRQQINQYPNKAANDDDIVCQNTEHTCQFMMLAEKDKIHRQKAFEKIHERVHDIGESKAQEKWCAEGFQVNGCSTQTAADVRQVTDDFFK